MSTAEVSADELPAWARALEIALSLERSFEESFKEAGGTWPEGCCVEASVSLRDELVEKVPDAGATYIWGEFIVGTPVDDSLVSPEGISLTMGHAWVELADGHIIDMTAGQFYRGSSWALRFLKPDSPVRWRWHELDRPAHV